MIPIPMMQNPNPDHALLQQFICNLFWICMTIHLTVGLPFGPLPWGAIIGFVLEPIATLFVFIIDIVYTRWGFVFKVSSAVLAFAVESLFGAVLTCVALTCMHWGFIVKMCTLGFLYFLLTPAFLYIPCTTLLRYMGQPETSRNVLGAIFYVELAMYVTWTILLTLSSTQLVMAVMIAVIAIQAMRTNRLLTRTRALENQYQTNAHHIHNIRQLLANDADMYQRYVAPGRNIVMGPTGPPPRPAIPAQSVQPRTLRSHAKG